MDEIEDVTQDSSPAIEDVNQDSSVQESAESSTAQESELSAGVQPDPKKPAGAIDYEEVARHVTRFLAPQLKQQVEERLSTYQQAPQTFQAPQAQPSTDPIQAQLAPYTEEQLEAYAMSDPSNAPIYRKEVNRRIKEQTKQEILGTIKADTKKQTFEQEQQTALNTVFTNYTEATTVINGQKVWNTSSPLYQRAIQLYSSRPTFKEDGMGLAGAFDMAYGQLAREDKLNITKQKTQLTAQQRKQDKVQSQAIGAGSQSAPQSNVSGTKIKLAKLMEQHNKTGDPKIMAEILKMKGAMPSFA